MIESFKDPEGDMEEAGEGYPEVRVRVRVRMRVRLENRVEVDVESRVVR